MTPKLLAFFGFITNKYTPNIMGNDHSHKVGEYNRAFAIGVILNIVFVVLEVIYGLVADSLALITDAGHNLSDVVSLLIVAVIFIGTWGLLRGSINYAMDAVPHGIDLSSIQQYLTSFDRVSRIHDLHVWPLSTTAIALTVHLVVKDDSLDNEFLCRIQQHFHDHFGIEHTTIQVEASNGEETCLLDREKCV